MPDPVDIVIVTVREDENRAVLDRIPGYHVETRANRSYAIGTLSNRHGPTYDSQGCCRHPTDPLGRLYDREGPLFDQAIVAAAPRPRG